jgi:hypothetical protein
MTNRNIKFARFLGIIDEQNTLGLWYLENQEDKDIDFANDWNKIHELKEFIETKYEVFVHILGKGCLITTSCPKLLEANGWNDCLVMLEPTSDEVEKLTGIEWANRTLEIFVDKIENFLK